MLIFKQKNTHPIIHHEATFIIVEQEEKNAMDLYCDIASLPYKKFIRNKARICIRSEPKHGTYIASFTEDARKSTKDNPVLKFNQISEKEMTTKGSLRHYAAYKGDHIP